MTPAPPSQRTRKKVRTHRRRPLIVRFWWMLPMVAVALGAGWWLLKQIPEKNHARALVGYVTQVGLLDQEYARYHGVALKDGDARAQFQQAARLQASGEYNGALLLLETVVKKAEVPVVFNDMGVLYAALGDRARAINSFRDALARDFDYVPVRQNLDRWHGFTSNSADPVSSEIEPNGNNENANVIAMNKPVDGEISALDNDVDAYKVTSPPAPRDLIEIQLQNRSKTLAPRLTIYDEDGVILPWGKDVATPGASLTQELAPKPNTTIYLHIFGTGTSSGAYTLTVKALKAFDAYEPDDDIYSARKIATGQQIEANIMDADDTDFYSFVGPRTGSVTIDIANRSSTLIPAISLYSQDKRLTGFGPDVTNAGGPLEHVMQVQQGNTYYVQVWSQGRTAGNYSLKIE